MQSNPTTNPAYSDVRLQITGKGLQSSSNYISPLKRKWNRLSRFQRTLITLLLIGVIVLFYMKYHSYTKIEVIHIDKKPMEPPIVKYVLPRSDDNRPLLSPIKHVTETNSTRLKAVVAAMRHSWEAYRKYAWGMDEVYPLTQSKSTWMGAALTMIDSLDTLWIMGMRKEFDEARAYVAGNVTFNLNKDHVNVFETIIRILGGLLAAHDLSADKMFLEKALDLGERILPAFGTESGIPMSDINLGLKRGQNPVWTSDSSLAEATTLQLELNELTRLTGQAKFKEAGDKTLRVVHEQPKKDGLMPIFISTITGKVRMGSPITLGARGDSYYEYLLKVWVQGGKKDMNLRQDYIQAIQGMKRHLLRRSKPNGLLFVGELMSGYTFSSKMDHLVCFLPGTLAYGVLHGMPKDHLVLAKELMKTCYELYRQMPTGLSPEIVIFNFEEGSTLPDFSVKSSDKHNLQRPETVESLFYLYRITGDPMYREWGWKIFQSFERYTKVQPYGYVSISDVTDTKNVGQRTKCESFWLAETLKYFYLLFSNDSTLLPLTETVFNTEAHPFPIPKSEVVAGKKQIRR